MIKLFVGGFPLDSDELEIVKLFAPYGDVHTIKIVRDKVSKKCKGYAFLEMTTAAGGEDAIQGLDGTLLNGRELKVRAVTENIEGKPGPSAQKAMRFAAAPRPKRPRRPI
jgi:RNA recognition motif-containing protein